MNRCHRTSLRLSRISHFPPSLLFVVMMGSVANAQDTPPSQRQPFSEYNDQTQRPGGSTQPKPSEVQPPPGAYAQPAPAAQPNSPPGYYTPAPNATSPKPDIPPGYPPQQNTPAATPMIPPGYYPPPQTAPAPQPNSSAGYYAPPQPSIPVEGYPLRHTQAESDLYAIWGLRFSPFLSASYTLEESLDDESYRKGSQDFKFSFALGAFGEHRLNKYFAIGGDFDFLLLNPKMSVSRHDIEMLSLGPAVRLTIPLNSVELYLRAVGALSVAFLPDELTHRTMVYSNGTSGNGQYQSHALGYAFKLSPGLMYRTEQMGFFVALAFEFSQVYTKLDWANGTVADLSMSPQLFGLEMGMTFMP
jgi:hypothetical protein